MPADFKTPVVLGRTGLKVSRLGIASGYKAPASAIERAFHEYGINYFYWSSPRGSDMGEALKNLAPKNREKMVITFQSYDHFGPFMHKYFEKGLKSIDVDYVDVLLLGWFNYIPGGRVLDAALKLKEQGKVRFLAMSGHNRTLFGKMAQDEESPIDIYMIRYNAAHRGAEKDIFPHLSEEKKKRPGITIYTATCWRKLLKAKKMPPGEAPMTAAECYRFVLSNPNVDLCMAGPANENQMEEAMKAIEQGPLSEDEMKRINTIGDFVHS